MKASPAIFMPSPINAVLEGLYEANTSMAITSWTTTLALRIRLTNDKSLLGIHLLANFGWYRSRAETAPVQADYLHERAAEKAVGCPPYRLTKCQRDLADRLDSGIDGQCIVEARRQKIIDFHPPNREHDPGLTHQDILAEAQRTQPFGACPLEKFQVVRVVHDAASVGIFVIYADWPLEYAH